MAPLVVITGASGGIGEQVALQLAAKGYRLGLIARRADELDRVAAQCGGSDVAVTAVADVTDRVAVERAFKEITAAAGQPVDVLVNNAGRGNFKLPSELTDADIDDMMSVNVKSAIYCVAQVLPGMRARKSGQIVNISSFLGRVALYAPTRAAYSGAKHFLNAYTCALRGELAAVEGGSGVVISTVSPGPVATEFGDNAGGGVSSKSIPNVQDVPSAAAVVVKVIAERIEEAYTAPELYGKVLAVYTAFGKPVDA